MYSDGLGIVLIKVHLFEVFIYLYKLTLYIFVGSGYQDIGRMVLIYKYLIDNWLCSEKTLLTVNWGTVGVKQMERNGSKDEVHTIPPLIAMIKWY